MNYSMTKDNWIRQFSKYEKTFNYYRQLKKIVPKSIMSLGVEVRCNSKILMVALLKIRIPR